MHPFNSQSFVILIIAVFMGFGYGCQYSSREYQVMLNPEIFAQEGSFFNGVHKVVDFLTVIERNGSINFQVSRSSLKFNNISIVNYESQNQNDLKLPIIMKSRRKQADQLADFVLKISSADPELACVQLDARGIYDVGLEHKVEMDFHAYQGKVMAKTATSYTINEPNLFRNDQYIDVNVSSLFTDASKKLTYSNHEIIANPLASGIQLTAEFNIRFNDEKFKGSIFLLDIGNRRKCEFSFRIKGDNISKEILQTAQEFAAQVSGISAITMNADH